MVGRVGFNYRWNPLYARLRDQLRGGVIGQPIAVRSSFCTPTRIVPAWRQSRDNGGGVLLDLASHHIDMLRFLFDVEVIDVSASIRSIASDADTALLTLRLSNGVEVQSRFCSTAIDEDRWEILGDRGQLALDRYRCLDIELTPAGAEFSLARRTKARLNALRHLPYLLEKRRAAAHEPSFLASVESFLRAIQRELTTGADLFDGLRSLEVVEAAEQSAASSGARIAIQHAARPAPVGRQTLSKLPAASQSSHAARQVTLTPLPDGVQPAMSVILATNDNFSSIRRTIRCLAQQTVANQLELILLAPDASQLQLEKEELKPFLAYGVVEVGPIHSHALANAAAVRFARAQVIAFAEDHAYPEPHWAEALIHAHRLPHAAVCPVVVNANPRTLTSWADLVTGYGPWMAPHPGGSAPFLPGHNTSYKRDVLLSYGDRLDEMMVAEAVMHWDLRSKGHTLHIEPNARLAHTNFALFPIFMRLHYHCGRIFAAARAAHWSWPRRIIYAGGSPLLPLIRGLRSLNVIRRAQCEGCPSPLRLMPVLLAGLCMDAFGQMLGYVIGEGASSSIIADLEFNRWRFSGENQLTDTTPNNKAHAMPSTPAILHDIPSPGDSSKPPAISVILLTPDNFASIAKTIRHLRAQDVCDQLELLIVAPTFQALSLDAAAVAGFARVRVVEVGRIVTPTPAKIIAARLAAAPVVAFAEDHCYPEPGWAAGLIEAHRDPKNAAVGPVILNANPATLRSWANYIGCFARWSDPIDSGPTDQTPWHNTSYKRDILLSYGDRLPDLLDVEGLLQAELRQQGHQVYLQSSAKARHLNISRASSLIKQAFCGGRIFGDSRARNGHWPAWRRLLYIGGAPLVPLIRLRREIQMIHRIGQAGRLLPRIIPLLLAQLSAHACGEACGYAFGAGEVKKSYASYEIYRRKHITPADVAEDSRVPAKPGNPADTRRHPLNAIAATM